MARSNLRTLSAKILLAVALATTAAPPASAQFGGIVYDPTNFAKNAQTALTQVKSLAQQIQQYQLQIQQYQNMVKNTVAPAAYIWDQAQRSITGLRTSVDQLEALKTQSGGLNNLLNQFQNTSYYRSSPCFTASGCTPAQRLALQSQIDAKRATAMASNESVLRGIDAQQAKLSADAAQLESIQSGAQGAQGQMEALGFANQLASSSANQLVQIRGLLLAQSAAATAQAQALADHDAMVAAATEQARKTSYTPSAAGNYQWAPPH